MSESKKKILVVEDNPHLGFLFKRLLQKNSLDCELVQNGQEAIKLLAMDESIDLILLDIMMPVMDGVSFLKNARSVLKEREIKVCMISALGEFEKLVECLNVGAHDYIIKMPEEETLINKIFYLRGGSGLYKHVYVGCNVTQKARLRTVGDIDITITNISEDHIVFETDQEVGLNEVIFVGEGPLCQKFFDGERFFMRCFQLLQEGSKYKVKACFIGLSEEKAKDIRSKTMKLFELVS